MTIKCIPLDQTISCDEPPRWYVWHLSCSNLYTSCCDLHLFQRIMVCKDADAVACAKLIPPRHTTATTEFDGYDWEQMGKMAAAETPFGRNEEMHSYETDGGTVFNFNSDLSGLVRIYRKTADGKEHEMWLPGKDLISFVLLHHVVPQWSRELERRLIKQLML